MRTPLLIIIVDDNPANVDILQAQLAANNCEIITAPDGEAGLAMARDRTLLKRHTYCHLFSKIYSNVSVSCCNNSSL
jgi:CheY-like chemotaxis protein